MQLSASQLKDAIAASEVQPYVQSIVRLDNESQVGSEVLARWIKPDGEVVAPSHFIPAVERFNLSDSMLLSLFQQTLSHARELTSAVGGESKSISFNISPKQVCDTHLLPELLKLTDRFGVAPGQLFLEITETFKPGDRAAVSQVIPRYREAGFRIALDDFGTGLSSINDLYELPMDMIKIDQSFVSLIDRREAALVIESVIRIGSDLDVRIVAEGVETERQAEQLREFGCEYAQGYLYEKPHAIN